MSDLNQLEFCSVNVHLTEAERLNDVRLTSQNVNQPQKKSPWWFSLVWILVFAGLVYAMESGQLPGNKLTLLLIFVVCVMGASFYRQKQIFKRVARHTLADFQLQLTTQGITLLHQNGEVKFNWDAIENIKRSEQSLSLYLSSLQVISLPERSFSEDFTINDFIEKVQQYSGKVTSEPETTINKTALQNQSAGFWYNLRENLIAGLWFFLRPVRAVNKLHVTGIQLVCLILFSLAINIVGDWLYIGVESTFEPAGLPNILYFVPLILFMCWSTAAMIGNESRFLAGAVAVMSVDVVGTPINYLILFLSDHFLATGWSYILVWAFYAWIVFASMMALLTTQQIKLPYHRFGAVLLVLALMVYPTWKMSQLYVTQLWQAPYDETEYSAWQEKHKTLTGEAVLYSQPALLDSALASIPVGREGTPEFYAISFAGYGSQDVFLREVIKTDALFSSRFDAQGHLVLANNPQSINEYPIASLTALKKVLNDMAQKMNKDEDVLLLFMTSHGASDFKFSLELWPYQFDDLTPETLQQALDEAGIQYRAIIVSACYSGGFVEKMADDNTLIMSASRSDRNSHGCSHEAEWTFFGEALFKQALQETYSLEKGFEIAKSLVAERENKEAYKPSEPQIAIGAAIQPVIRNIETRLEGRRKPQRTH